MVFCRGSDRNKTFESVIITNDRSGFDVTVWPNIVPNSHLNTSFDNGRPVDSIGLDIRIECVHIDVVMLETKDWFD